MSTAMYQIKDFIQNFIDTTCSVIEFDMYVVDSNLSRVAGTGKFRALVGLSLPMGSANDYAMKSGDLTILDNPVESPMCDTCPIKPTGNCYQEHMIIYPIFQGETFLGNISIVAFEDDLKEKMHAMQEKLIDFLEKLGDTIITKINEQKTSDRFLSVMDTISEGIIVADHTGKIISHNDVMKDIVKDREDIRLILPKGYFENAMSNVDDPEKTECEVDLRCGTSSLKMFVTVKSINGEALHSDILFIFKHKKELGDIAYKLLADASHLNINIDSIIGNSKQINRTKQLAKQAARYDSNVLILGESGTGKELFARSIHEMSERKNEPFIAINCAAIPENLLESELFGYENGAFTGAKKSGKPGKFELANGGTIFLDEVGDMSLHLQPKLLRVIEYGQLERIGGVSPIGLDVRIIAATNKNLEEMVERDQFREDLFYRLCVIPINIPSLKKRPDDILVLAEFFLDKYNDKFKKRILGLSEEVKRHFLLYSWPGNVRELENIIEYAVNVEAGDRLTLESVPDKVLCREQQAEEMNLKTARKKYIESLLIKHGNTLKGKQKIADELGISLSTLYRDMKKYNL